MIREALNAIVKVIKFIWVASVMSICIIGGAAVGLSTYSWGGALGGGAIGYVVGSAISAAPEVLDFLGGF